MAAAALFGYFLIKLLSISVSVENSFANKITQNYPFNLARHRYRMCRELLQLAYSLGGRVSGRLLPILTMAAPTMMCGYGTMPGCTALLLVIWWFRVVGYGAEVKG